MASAVNMNSYDVYLPLAPHITEYLRRPAAKPASLEFHHPHVVRAAVWDLTSTPQKYQYCLYGSSPAATCHGCIGHSVCIARALDAICVDPAPDFFTSNVGQAVLAYPSDGFPFRGHTGNVPEILYITGSLQSATRGEPGIFQRTDEGVISPHNKRTLRTPFVHPNVKFFF